MRKNILQILTLILCLVLLAVAVCQAKKIAALEQQTENRIEYLQDYLNQEIQKLSDNVQRELEEANSLVDAFSLEPCGIDADTGSLTAGLCVELKQWSNDTEVVVFAEFGSDKTVVALAPSQEGIYRGQVQIPLKNGNGLSLEVNISTGGTTRSEQLGSWGDISMLLPLRVNGSGWSGPNYVNGAMSTRFHIALGAPEEQEVLVLEPAFDIYKNGILSDTVSAVIDPDSYSSDGICYTTDTPGNSYALDCEPTDVIEIRFRCRDAYGLSYDFLVMTWSAENKLAEPLTGEYLILSWEK